MHNYRLLVALIVGLAFCTPAAAKLYKWVDDKGITHYGETIPPEFAAKERAELNKAGRIVNKEEALTPEELRAKGEVDAKLREDEKAAREQRRYDLTLTSTYTTADEIDLARNRSLQQIDARINSINSQLKMSSNSMVGLQKESDAYTKASKPIPESLHDDLQQTQSRLERLKQTLEKIKEERTTVDARYDSDKSRYQRLTGR